MPEYVYALFEFAPENPDEINFKAGDRIEVIEKDDVYGDGWWQVSSIRSVALLIRCKDLVLLGLCFWWTVLHGARACCEYRKGCRASLLPSFVKRAYKNT